jgi:hypothetical protein
LVGLRWVRHIGKAAILAPLAVGLAAMAYLRMQPEPKPEYVGAVVEQIGPLGRGGILVIFRTENGLQGQSTISLKTFQCRKGERVTAERIGVTVRLARGACQKRNPWPII